MEMMSNLIDNPERSVLGIGGHAVAQTRISRLDGSPMIGQCVDIHPAVLCVSSQRAPCGLHKYLSNEVTDFIFHLFLANILATSFSSATVLVATFTLACPPILLLNLQGDYIVAV